MSAPSLVAASAPASMAVKLKRKRVGEWDGPVLARFPHGPPAQLTSAANADDISFKLYANPEERKSSQRILTANTPGVVYGAQNYGPTQSYKHNSNTYAIGVFDPTKSKCRIVAVKHVFHLNQYVKALDALEPAAAAEGEEDTFAVKQRALADTFGSKKTQKRLASRAANQVTVQESTSQVLTHAVGSIAPNEEAEAEEELLDNIRANVLPPFDETAQNVREIYPQSGLIPPSVGGSLTVPLKAWRSLVKKGPSAVKKDAKSETPVTTSLFVRQRLDALAQLEHEGDTRDETLRLLLWIDLMLRFRNSPQNKRKVMGDWDESVASDRAKEHLLHSFTNSVAAADGSMRAVFDGPAEQKLLCHIAVASVLACNFTMQGDHIDAIATDLRMTASDMLKYYIEAGCSATKNRIHLSAPLKLPKLRKKLDRKK